MVRLRRTWRASYVVWRIWIQERGYDLRRRLPLSHHFRMVRRLVTARSSSLRRVPGTLPSSVTASETLGTFKRRLKTRLSPRHSRNFFKLRTSDFVLFFDFEKCS